MELETKICKCMYCNKEFSEDEISHDAERICDNCALRADGQCDDDSPSGCLRFSPLEACPYCGAKDGIADIGAEGVSFVGKVVSIGNSQGMYMTQELKAMGAKTGQELKVSLRRIK